MLSFVSVSWAQVNVPKARVLESAKAQKKLVPMRSPSKAPSDYGTVEVVMMEDFSKLTTGSVGAPDMDSQLNDEELYPYPVWMNIKPEYTVLPQWGGHCVFSAGGSICISAEEYEGGNLNTPMLDASKYDGVVFVEFRVRTDNDKVSQNMIVEAAETYNMQPSWKTLGSYVLPDITDEWQTMTAMFYGAEHYTMFNFPVLRRYQGDELEPIYFDYVKVYQVKPYVNMPTALPHTKYKGTSFNANWTKIKDAESYLLNVYSVKINEEMQSADTTYLYKDQAVNDTTFTVENAVSGETYYYEVRAVKDGHQSFMSPAMEVFDLVVPELGESTIKDGKYTATWNAVPTAERYNYIAYHEREATANGEFVITNEDFTGVKDAEGNLTGWTVEEPSQQSYDDFYMKEVNQAGWHVKQGAPYTDFMCVDGWQYIFGHKDAGLISPELDLSKDNGKVNLSVRLYGVIAEGYDQPYQTECAVALFNFNEEKGDFDQAELVYPKDVKPEWKTFNVELTKGSKRSVIGIYAVNGPENLYIDDVKITQNYNAGDTFKDPFLFQRFIEGTSLEVNLPGKTSGNKVYHRINAAKSNSSRGLKETDYSEMKYVGKSDVVSSVANVSLSKATVQLVDGNVIVNNADGENVSIYRLDGTLVYSNNSGSKNITAAMPCNGAYIVKVGNKSVKLVY